MSRANLDMAASALALLHESLAIWRVAGTVQAGSGQTAAIVRADSGICLYIDVACAEDAPVRWWVRWRDQPSAPLRSRPCTSAVGLLRTARDALGVAPGLRVLIAPNGTGGA